jgi:hypothetical protein
LAHVVSSEASSVASTEEAVAREEFELSQCVEWMDCAWGKTREESAPFAVAAVVAVLVELLLLLLSRLSKAPVVYR